MTTPTSRTAAELLPCPHCGGKAGFRREHDPDGHLFLRIECNQCHACSAQKWSDDPCPITYQEIRDTWNRRTPSAPPAAVTISRQMFYFLTGEDVIYGVGFGEKHPVHKGNFWWRTRLRDEAALPPREPPAAESAPFGWLNIYGEHKYDFHFEFGAPTQNNIDHAKKFAQKIVLLYATPRAETQVISVDTKLFLVENDGKRRVICEVWAGPEYTDLIAGESLEIPDAEPQAAMNGWLPIATAPKHVGSRVLLCFGTDRPFIGCLNYANEWWDERELVRNPSHWQPLPSPPVREGGAG